MLRILLTVMCLGTTLLSFSNENTPQPNELPPLELPSEATPFIYIGYGMGNVLADAPQTALDYLETAESLLIPGDELLPTAKLLIAFTRAVAYDNLGLLEKCEQAIGCMILTLSEHEDSDDIDDFFEDSKIVTQLMKDVAAKASSFAVRNFLLEIAEDDDDDDIFFNDNPHWHFESSN